jgi:hypothetical protein
LRASKLDDILIASALRHPQSIKRARKEYSMNTSTLRSNNATLCVYGIAAGVATWVIGYSLGYAPKRPRLAMPGARFAGAHPR